MTDPHHQKAPDPVRCPTCRSRGRVSRTRVAIKGSEIHVCGECSCYFLFPPVTAGDTWSEWASHREANWERDVEIAGKHAPAIREYLEGVLQRPVRTVLEIGCGSGFMGVGFGAIGCEYTGIDLDPGSVEFAQRRGIDARCLAAEDIGRAALPHDRYDLILSSHVFEHVQDPLGVLENLRAVCAGVLVVIVPNPRGLFPRLKALKAVRWLLQCVTGDRRETAYSIDGHWHNIAYTQDCFRYLCRKTGWTPLKNAPMDINDRVFGFALPNPSALSRIAFGVAHLLGMDSDILLIARPMSSP